ncbi:MAG: 50S ribosomal protein L31 [Elusimicrobia bacterium RIFCSPLOWO2_01_FULL_54_10]|nr:MAG: 50S ribosomal protein L31 [Elusimicrobia bacterium RIFCSPLOWO2_01_FULL_54_10]
MKPGIHPNYVFSTVNCACGHTFQTRSTRPTIRLEICSNCHPFFTGRQKLVDSAGRVERFTKRFEKTQGQTVRTKAKEKAAVKVSKTSKILSTGAKKAAKPEIKEKKPAKSK